MDVDMICFAGTWMRIGHNIVRVKARRSFFLKGAEIRLLLSRF